MRGEVSPQSGLFAYVPPARRIPADHPLRTIKAYADQALAEISADLGMRYDSTGRPSIAPERLLKGQQLLGSGHFTVDSNLIECRASLKSLRKKGGPPPKDGSDGTAMVDFRGERHTNATHESTTNPAAKLMRRGFVQPARLGFGGHSLMDNRAGLGADLAITDARLAEPRVAEQLMAWQRRKRIRIDTRGAD